MGARYVPKSDAEVQEWVRRGLIDPADLERRVRLPGEAESVDEDEPKKKKLLPACFIAPATWLIPVELYSIANSRDTRKAIGRKGHQKTAVFLAMGKNHAALVPFADEGIHAGKLVRVQLCRFGVRRMDDDNLAACAKYARDAIADLLGSKDNNPLLRWEYSQETGDRYGLRVTLTHV